MNEKAINSLRRITAREALRFTERDKSAPQQLLVKNWIALSKGVKQIGQSNDLATIVAAERHLIENDLDRYANSRDMKSSLSGALEDFDRIEKHMAWVADPAHYRMVNEAYDKEKNRIRGLPKDEARQAFVATLFRHESRRT